MCTMIIISTEYYDCNHSSNFLLRKIVKLFNLFKIFSIVVAFIRYKFCYKPLGLYICIMGWKPILS